MDTNWIPLHTVPAAGSLLRLEDQRLWEQPIGEFRIPCRIVKSIIAEITILPQEKGVLFRGNITGEVALPCDRCSEDSIVSIDHRFDGFEPFPADPYYMDDDREKAEAWESDAAVIRNAPFGRGIEINPTALAWEEFSLALPVKPLCTENCKGICPACGANRNTEDCACIRDEGDPRLAALRGLTLRK